MTTERDINELARSAQQGDAEAAERLYGYIRRHLKMVIRVKQYFVRGMEWEDLLQEGLCGVARGLPLWDPQNGMSFQNFAILCAERRLKTLMTESHRLKRTPIGGLISLDRSDGENHQIIRERIVPPGWREQDPAERLCRHATERERWEQLMAGLSPLERKVVEFRLTYGNSYQAAMMATGKHWKAIDNAFQRAKRKLSRSGLGPIGKESAI